MAGRTRCAACDFDGIELGSSACPECRTPVPDLFNPAKNQPKNKNKSGSRKTHSNINAKKIESKKRPSLEKHFAILRRPKTRKRPSWVLDGFGGNEIAVSFEGPELPDGSTLSPNDVTDKELLYEVETRGRSKIARPVPNEQLRALIAMAISSGRTRILTQKRVAELARTAPLLQFDQAELRQSIERIKLLTSERDDPEAWAELAHGYSSDYLRSPVQQAIKEIGWEKFAILREIEEEYPGSWHPGLFEYLDELEQTAKNKPAPSTVHRGFQSGDYRYRLQQGH